MSTATTTKRRQSQDEQRAAAVDRRVGQTPQQRLRWAVEVFLRANLDQEIPEEIAAFGVYLKRFVPSPSAPREVLLANLGPSEGLSPAQVRSIQHRFREGLTSLRQDAEWSDVPTPSS